MGRGASAFDAFEGVPLLGRLTARRRNAARHTAIGIGVAAAAGLGFASWWSGRRALPSWSGQVRVPGVSAPVEIYRDKWGVPSVFAQDEADLFFAQGYLHASDRLFQMDLFRRVGYGRLSELIGPAGLASDKLVRTLGFGRSADAEIEMLGDDASTILGHFSRGVNAFIEQAGTSGLPFEFDVLGYTPEPWKPQHSLVFAKLMALGLSGNWEAELVRLEIAEQFGIETLRLLDEDEETKAFPSQIDPAILGKLAGAVRQATADVGAGAGTGSNNWVIAPEHTASGGAILANDPHLDLSLPALWHECVLRSPTFNVRGFSIPGSPGIVIGHNGTISWGLTNSCADVQDLYVETIDAERGTYLDTDGQSRLDSTTETISIKGEEPFEFTFRSTRRGPLLTDAVDTSLAHPMTIRWDSAGPGRLFDGVLAINRATNWSEFRNGCRNWTAPSMNVVYADRDGNIGFQFTGDVPIRHGGDGRIPYAGNDPEGEWLDTIPFDELPHAFNPDNGRIVTANDKVVPDDYEHFISREWMSGYRGIRIRELLDRDDGHTVPMQSAIQTDTYSLPGREMIGVVRELHPRPGSRDGAELYAALCKWDFQLDAGGEAAEGYRLFVWALQEQVFGYLDDLLATFLGKSRSRNTGFWSLLARTLPRVIVAIREGDEELIRLAQRHYSASSGSIAPGSPRGPLDEDATVEPDGEGPATGSGYIGPRREVLAGWTPPRDWRDAVERALDVAGGQLYSQGKSHAHMIRFQHPLGVVPGLARLVNRGPYEVPGDTDTVWQTSRFASDVNDAAVVGPSHRFAIDMADLDSGASIVAGGVSGHPNSPHYVDQLPLWRQGRTKPAPWSAGRLIDSAHYSQRIEPSGR